MLLLSCSKIVSLSVTHSPSLSLNTPLIPSAFIHVPFLLPYSLFNYRWFFVQLMALLSTISSYTIYKTRVDCAPSLQSTKPIVYSAFLETIGTMLLFISVGLLPGVLSVLVPQVRRSIPLRCLFMLLLFFFCLLFCPFALSLLYFIRGPSPPLPSLLSP